MSTSHSNNPFLGFSIRRARSPPNPLNSPEDEIFTEEAPLLQTMTTPTQSRPASSFPIFPIITPIMNPFAVGHPTGLQTITAHGPPSSGSTRDCTRRSNNPFNPSTRSSPFHSPVAENIPLPNSAGSGTFFPLSPINAPPAWTPPPPAPPVPPRFPPPPVLPPIPPPVPPPDRPCRTLSICLPQPLPNCSPRSSTNYSR